MDEKAYPQYYLAQKHGQQVVLGAPSGRGRPTGAGCLKHWRYVSVRREMAPGR